jgi:UDP-N-acetylglucosamine:LPS N-acetylglucosamine transferase
MIIRPDFYRPLVAAPHDERLALGLDPDRPTGLVMFGGQGSMKMLSIAKQLDDVQLVLLCGHNTGLEAKLREVVARSAPGSARRVVVGFTADVRRYMRISDFFIGKPGPGSVSEALQQGLPIVTVRNAWTMPQERYNTDWIVEQGVGLVGTSMRDIRPQVDALLERLDAFKATVRELDNRAVFEVPAILARLLEASRDAEVVSNMRASSIHERT